MTGNEGMRNNQWTSWIDHESVKKSNPAESATDPLVAVRAALAEIEELAQAKRTEADWANAHRKWTHALGEANAYEDAAVRLRRALGEQS